MFKGIYTALITPFKNGELDLESFGKLVNWQIESGINGLIVAGSTGEGQSLTKEEFLILVEKAVAIAKGRVPIIANTGLTSTFNSIELTQAAQEKKVDAVMLAAPSYIRPTQEGLYQHFKSIHDLTNIPIVIYNVPGRTGVDISDDTIAKLAKLKRIVALKDATGNVLRCIKLRKKVDSNFRIFSGDDALTLPFYSQGAVGTMSVVSNIVPSLAVKMHNLWHNNQIKEAIELQDILYPLNEALFCESNPVPVKYAASQFGICAPDVRLPLVTLSESSKQLLRDVLKILEAHYNK